jgi:hypothetical protein
MFATTSDATLIEGFEISTHQINSVFFPRIRAAKFLALLGCISYCRADFPSSRVHWAISSQSDICVCWTRAPCGRDAEDPKRSAHDGDCGALRRIERRGQALAFIPSTDISYSLTACLLSSLRHDGIKANLFMKVIATFTGFAPLICDLFRIVETKRVLCCDVAAVTVGLYGFCASFLPDPSSRTCL